MLEGRRRDDLQTWRSILTGPTKMQKASNTVFLSTVSSRLIDSSTEMNQYRYCCRLDANP